MQVIVVSLTKVNATACPPTWTVVAPVKYSPVTVMLVLPAARPEVGLMLLTIGAGYGWIRWSPLCDSRTAAWVNTDASCDDGGLSK